jgi:excisionase family DNA binding protein
MPESSRSAVAIRPEPIAISIADACSYIGCGRSLLYELIGNKQISAVKLGRRTLVPVASLHAYVASLPSAQVKPKPFGKQACKSG